MQMSADVADGGAGLWRGGGGSRRGWRPSGFWCLGGLASRRGFLLRSPLPGGCGHSGRNSPALRCVVRGLRRGPRGGPGAPSFLRGDCFRIVMVVKVEPDCWIEVTVGCVDGIKVFDRSVEVLFGLE